MSVLNVDLPLSPARLRRVFDTVQVAGGVDATRFIDPSFLADSRGP